MWAWRNAKGPWLFDTDFSVRIAEQTLLLSQRSKLLEVQILLQQVDIPTAILGKDKSF